MADGGFQPFSKGAREPGPALDAMLRGTDFAGFNPQDLKRQMQKGQGEQSTSGRPARPARPARPKRPAR